jgi:hypothetical protein
MTTSMSGSNFGHSSGRLAAGFELSAKHWA